MGWVCRMGELLLRFVGGVPWLLWCLSASSGCTARGWGATGGGLGVLGVGGAFVQYAQPLVSRSRPSWSRPTRADSGRSRRRTMTSGPRAGSGQGIVIPQSNHLCTRTPRRQRAGGGPVTEAPGCATKNPGLVPARPGVHSDLPDLFPSTSPSPPGPPACPGLPPERVPQKS